MMPKMLDSRSEELKIGQSFSDYESVEVCKIELTVLFVWMLKKVLTGILGDFLLVSLEGQLVDV